METKIFINMPVKNLDKSVEFFTHLGFTFNPQFTDKNATCMIISKNIFAMLLVEEYFRTFTKKEICDASKCIESIVAVSMSNRREVDDLLDKVKQAGGIEPKDVQDHGWMYLRTFEDIDGHMWEIFYMDENFSTNTSK